MITTQAEYPDRHTLANELHARPFAALSAPGRALLLAIKAPDAAVDPDRDRAADHAHLIALLDRFGAPHPAPDAKHHSAQLGRSTLKWERLTEIVTYTLFTEGPHDPAFAPDALSAFPAEWLAQAPGKILCAAHVHIATFADEPQLESLINEQLPAWFEPESLAVSRVQDGDAVIASDFRIDATGLTRFAIFARQTIGPRRLGRTVQRTLELEVYKSLSMLTLPVARGLSAQVADLDTRLTGVAQTMAMAAGNDSDARTLDTLLQISAQIEHLASTSAFRLSAAGAYSDIVAQRIKVLREERHRGRQTIGEFMIRRFDPAMRTCRSAERRLHDLSARAERSANLLRTRVDVANATQNAQVLTRMDDRAALQLRLQETVEGLSVVAISYYAVNLTAYLALPLAKPTGLDKTSLLAALTLPVIGLVWLAIRRIKRKFLSHH